MQQTSIFTSKVWPLQSKNTYEEYSATNENLYFKVWLGQSRSIWRRVQCNKQSSLLQRFDHCNPGVYEEYNATNNHLYFRGLTIAIQEYMKSTMQQTIIFTSEVWPLQSRSIWRVQCNKQSSLLQRFDHCNPGVYEEYNATNNHLYFRGLTIAIQEYMMSTMQQTIIFTSEVWPLQSRSIWWVQCNKQSSLLQRFDHCNPGVYEEYNATNNHLYFRGLTIAIQEYMKSTMQQTIIFTSEVWPLQSRSIWWVQCNKQSSLLQRFDHCNPGVYEEYNATNNHLYFRGLTIAIQEYMKSTMQQTIIFTSEVWPLQSRSIWRVQRNKQSSLLQRFDHCNPGVYEEYNATNKHLYFRGLTIAIQEYMKSTTQQTIIFTSEVWPLQSRSIWRVQCNKQSSLLQRFDHCNPGVYDEYNATNNHLYFRGLTIAIQEYMMSTMQQTIIFTSEVWPLQSRSIWRVQCNKQSSLLQRFDHCNPGVYDEYNATNNHLYFRGLTIAIHEYMKSTMQQTIIFTSEVWPLQSRSIWRVQCNKQSSLLQRFDHCNPGVYDEYNATNNHLYFRGLTIAIQEYMKSTMQQTIIFTSEVWPLQSRSIWRVQCNKQSSLLQRFDHCNPGVYEEYNATNNHLYFRGLTIAIQEYMKSTMQQTSIFTSEVWPLQSRSIWRVQCNKQSSLLQRFAIAIQEYMKSTMQQTIIFTSEVWPLQSRSIWRVQCNKQSSLLQRFNHCNPGVYEEYNATNKHLYFKGLTIIIQEYMEYNATNKHFYLKGLTIAIQVYMESTVQQTNIFT